MANLGLLNLDMTEIPFKVDKAIKSILIAITKAKLVPINTERSWFFISFKISNQSNILFNVLYR